MRWYGPMVVIPSWMCKPSHLDPPGMAGAWWEALLVRSAEVSLATTPRWTSCHVEENLESTNGTRSRGHCCLPSPHAERTSCKVRKCDAKVLRPLSFSAAKLVARWLESQDLHVFSCVEQVHISGTWLWPYPCTCVVLGLATGPKESRPFRQESWRKGENLEEAISHMGSNLWDPTEQPAC